MKIKENRTLVTLLIVFTLSWNLFGVESRPTDEQDDEDDIPELVIKQADASDSADANEGFWANRRPCKCKDSGCTCCIGALFPLPALRQRACMSLTYLGDPSTMNMSISFNRRVLFRNITSAEDPQPICASPPLFPRAEICVQLHNVFIRESNMHACVKIEGHYNERVMFGRTMGCMYMGANGIAILRPDAEGEIPGIEPGNNKPDNKPDNNKPDNNKPDNNKPENNKPENNKPENNKPENIKPDNNKPDNNIPDNSSQDNNKPGDSMPTDNTGPTDNTPDDEANDPLTEEEEVNNATIEENEDSVTGEAGALKKTGASKGSGTSAPKHKKESVNKVHDIETAAAV